MNYCLGGLTVLFAFLMMVTSQEDDEVQTLGLAEHAFDDQYLGCKRAMEKKLEEHGVLNIENGKNKRLKRAWKESCNIWSHRKNDLKAELPQGFEDEHGIALLLYTSFVRKDFNNAVRSAGKSYNSYMDEFGFKWLHFYVTSAFQILSQSKMFREYTIYSGIGDNIRMPQIGSIYVKFGHFLYTSLDKEEATVEGNTSLLIIDKYPGVNIANFSQYPSEREVMVPGYEVFRLIPSNEIPAVNEKYDFKLNTTRKFCSNFNCAYINGEKSKLSVHDCMNSAASSVRMHDLLCSSLVTLLLVVVVI